MSAQQLLQEIFQSVDTNSAKVQAMSPPGGRSEEAFISKRRKDTSRRVDPGDLSLEIMTTSGRRSSDPSATPVH